MKAKESGSKRKMAAYDRVWKEIVGAPVSEREVVSVLDAYGRIFESSDYQQSISKVSRRTRISPEYVKNVLDAYWDYLLAEDEDGKTKS